MDKCQSCYTCEKGVAPSVDKEQFLKATENGKKPIPQEMIVQNCANCYTCQRCYTSQQSKG